MTTMSHSRQSSWAASGSPAGTLRGHAALTLDLEVSTRRTTTYLMKIGFLLQCFGFVLSYMCSIK